MRKKMSAISALIEIMTHMRVRDAKPNTPNTTGGDASEIEG